MAPDLASSIDDLQAELPALERQEHPAELLPGELAAIDHYDGQRLGVAAVIARYVPPDRAWRHQVRPGFVVDQLLSRKTSSHAFIQLGKQLHRIAIHLAENSELISAGRIADQLEGLDHLAGAAQPSPHVQHVWAAVTVGQRDGLWPPSMRTLRHRSST